MLRRITMGASDQTPSLSIAMADKPVKPPVQKPADIARDAFRQLATRRIAPTPDAYRDAYDEISGNVTPTGAEIVLSSFAESIASSQSEIADFGIRFSRAVAAHDWKDCSKSLGQLLEKCVDRAVAVDTFHAALVVQVAVVATATPMTVRALR